MSLHFLEEEEDSEPELSKYAIMSHNLIPKRIQLQERIACQKQIYEREIERELNELKQLEQKYREMQNSTLLIKASHFELKLFKQSGDEKSAEEIEIDDKIGQAKKKKEQLERQYYFQKQQHDIELSSLLKKARKLKNQIDDAIDETEKLKTEQNDDRLLISTLVSNVESLQARIKKNETKYQRLSHKIQKVKKETQISVHNQFSLH